MRTIRALGMCLTGAAYTAFIGGGIVQWVWCVVLANKLWGVLGIVVLCVVPPFAYLFPFVVWIVTHSFPVFYFAVWAVSLVGAGGFYWAGSTLADLSDETWSRSHERRSLLTALTLGVLLLVAVGFGLSFGARQLPGLVEAESGDFGYYEPTTDFPPLDAEELSDYSEVLAKADKQPLAETDLAKLRGVMEHYTRRTGTWLTKEELDASVQLINLSADYQYELGQSLLFSWDRKERFTTRGYGRLSEKASGLGLREPDKLAMDEACLLAAARNQLYVEDEEGRMYEFGRDIIIAKVKEHEVFRANADKMAEVWRDFVR